MENLKISKRLMDAIEYALTELKQICEVFVVSSFGRAKQLNEKMLIQIETALMHFPDYSQQYFSQKTIQIFKQLQVKVQSVNNQLLNIKIDSISSKLSMPLINPFYEPQLKMKSEEEEINECLDHICSQVKEELEIVLRNELQICEFVHCIKLDVNQARAQRQQSVSQTNKFKLNQNDSFPLDQQFSPQSKRLKLKVNQSYLIQENILIIVPFQRHKNLSKEKQRNKQIILQSMKGKIKMELIQNKEKTNHNKKFQDSFNKQLWIQQIHSNYLVFKINQNAQSIIKNFFAHNLRQVNSQIF